MSAVDWDRSTGLGEAGEPDYVAAVCVTDNGDTALWLVHLPDLGSAYAVHGEPHQPHERVGPLPRWLYDRIWNAPCEDGERCGRPRADGQPCRLRVSEAGAACCFHSDSGVHP